MGTKVSSILAEIGVDSSKFNAGAKGAAGSVGDLIGTIGSLNPVLLGLSGAFTAVAAYMVQAEQAANESNIVMAKQEAILKATGYAANIASSELQAMTSELSRMSGIDDEAITSAQSLMLTFRNIGRDEFPRAMQAAVDLQTTFGSLESASLQLGKALNDPVKGVTALTRSGVTFSDEQKKQIANFVETNQLAKAQGIILAEVENQVGGTAKAIEEASDGTNRLKVSTENLSEAIGQSLVPSAREWNNMLADAYDTIAGVIDRQSTFTGAMQTAGQELGYTNSQIAAYRQHLYAVPDELENATNETLRLTETGRRWEEALRDQGIQFEGNTSKIIAHSAAIQADEEAMNKANEATLKGVETWGDMEQSNTDKLEGLYSRRKDLEADLAKSRAQGYWEQSDQIQGILGKMSEVDAAIQNEKAQYEIKTRAVVLGYIEQKLAADGVLDDKETLWLLQKGVEWGVYKQTAIDAYRTASAEADAYAAHVRAIPDKTVTITTIYANVGGSSDISTGQGAANDWLNKNRKAAGGPSSGLTWVGENGPELVNLPGGSFVHNSNTSRQMAGAQSSDNSTALIAAFEQIANSMRIDYYQLSRAVRDGMSQVG